MAFGILNSQAFVELSLCAYRIFVAILKVSSRLTRPRKLSVYKQWPALRKKKSTTCLMDSNVCPNSFFRKISGFLAGESSSRWVIFPTAKYVRYQEGNPLESQKKKPQYSWWVPIVIPHITNFSPILNLIKSHILIPFLIPLNPTIDPTETQIFSCFPTPPFHPASPSSPERPLHVARQVSSFVCHQGDAGEITNHCMALPAIPLDLFFRDMIYLHIFIYISYLSTRSRSGAGNQLSTLRWKTRSCAPELGMI